MSSYKDFPNFFAAARNKEDHFLILRKCVLETDTRVDDQRYRLEAHMNQYVDLFEKKWRAEKARDDPEYEQKMRHLCPGREMDSWRELSLEDMHERMFGSLRDFKRFWSPITNDFVGVVRDILLRFKQQAVEKNHNLMLLMRRTATMVVQTVHKHIPQSKASFRVDVDAGNLGISLPAMDVFPALTVDMKAWNGNHVVLNVCNRKAVTWGDEGSIATDLRGQMDFFVFPRVPYPKMNIVLKTWGLNVSMAVNEPSFLSPEQVVVAACSLLELMYRRPLKYLEGRAAVPVQNLEFVHFCNMLSSACTEMGRRFGAKRSTYSDLLLEALLVFDKEARLRITIGDKPLQMSFQMSAMTRPLDRLDVLDMCKDILERECPGICHPSMVAVAYGLGPNISLECTWSASDNNSLKTMRALIAATTKILLAVPLDTGIVRGVDEAAGGGW